MFQEMKARNISLDQLTRAINLVNSLPQLYNEYSAVQKQIELVRADYQQRQDELWNIQNELHLKEMELRNIVIESNRSENIRNTSYRELCETVWNIIQQILGDKITLLKAALLAIIRALAKYPDHKTVLLNLSPRDLPNAPYVINDPNNRLGPELIAQANIFYDDIVAELVEKAIDRMN